jgi:hypothetical protein
VGESWWTEVEHFRWNLILIFEKKRNGTRSKKKRTKLVSGRLACFFFVFFLLLSTNLHQIRENKVHHFFLVDILPVDF